MLVHKNPLWLWHPSALLKLFGLTRITAEINKETSSWVNMHIYFSLRAENEWNVWLLGSFSMSTSFLKSFALKTSWLGAKAKCRHYKHTEWDDKVVDFWSKHCCPKIEIGLINLHSRIFETSFIKSFYVLFGFCQILGRAHCS